MYMFGMDMPRNSWITISKISRILPTRNHDLRLFTYTFNDKIYRYLNWFFLIYRLSCWYLPFFTKTEHKCSRRPVVSLSILLLKNIDLHVYSGFYKITLNCIVPNSIKGWPFLLLRHQVSNSTSGMQTFLEIHVQSLRRFLNEDKLD